MEHRPRKRFGQHFLHDSQTIERILLAVAPRPEQHIIEIGPGRGAITTGLLKVAGRLHAVELDRDLIRPLASLCADLGKLTIHHASVLDFDLCALYPGDLVRLVGNLPYNISTPLLFRLIDTAECIGDMHFMLQKEVAERIAAAPGTKVYGRLSVMIQTYCSAEPLFSVGREAFTPPPKVDSVFLRLRPHRPLPFPVADRSFLSRLVAQAFCQRRKTLRNSLASLLSGNEIQSQGIDPRLRAEELSVEAFVRLANAVCRTDNTPRIRLQV